MIQNPMQEAKKVIRSLFQKYWFSGLLSLIFSFLPSAVFIFYAGEYVAHFKTFPQNMNTMVIYHLIYLLGFFIIMQISHYLKGLLLSGMLSKINRYCKQVLFSKIIHQEFDDLNGLNEGKVSQKITNFSEFIADILNLFFVQMLPPLGEIFFMIILLTIKNPILGTFTLVWMFTFFSLVIIINKKLSSHSTRLTHYRNMQAGFIVDNLKNTIVNKAFGFDNDIYQQYFQQTEIEKKLYQKYSTLQWLQIFVLSMVNIIFLLVGMYISYLYILPIGMGDFLLALDFIFLISFSVWLILLPITPLFQKLGYCLSDNNMFDAKTFYQRGEISCPNKFEVKLEKVSRINEKNVLLKQADLTFESGNNVLIEGKSGSGKTTLFLLMLGIMKCTGGKITINGVDVMNLNHQGWLNKFAYVPQNAMLYNDTIRHNIVKGLDSYYEEDFIKVCKLCLVDDFAKDLENGYETLVGVSGNNLSGGQRQRIVLARALMREYNVVNGKVDGNKRILCLDEAWAALSREEAITIAKNLCKDLKHRGFIVIDHTGIWKEVCGKDLDFIYSIENGIVRKV